MTDEQTDGPPLQQPLRLLPGVIIVVLQWLVRFVIPALVWEFTPMGALGGFLGWLAILVWWGFFSRAPSRDRWGAVVFMFAAMAATMLVLDDSIAKAMNGMIFVLYFTPFLSLAFVLWAVTSRHLADGPRRATMFATILLVCVAWTLIRLDGMVFSEGAEFSWRWTETSEERLLALAGATPPVGIGSSGTGTSGLIWPGFRGPERNSIVRDLQIVTDWSTSPPVELWRRPIGPGWSSFAVNGDLFYTQEQRGDHELVVCYSLISGELVWRHRDGTRFWEAIGGPGPRATPTLHDGRVYTFGATGVLNVLDGGDGTAVWTRNVAADIGAEIPTWGLSS